MRIGHLSDLHIGSKGFGIFKRKEKLRENLTSTHEGGLLDTILKSKVEAVIISGDLFDNDHPTFDDQDCLRKFIDELRYADILVVGCTGNHEKQTGSMVQASDFFFKPVDLKELSYEVDIQLFNHHHRSELKALAETCRESEIIVLHQSMFGFLPDIMRPEIDEEVGNIFAEKCSYLALGDLHIHKKMYLNSMKCCAAYPGTIDFLRIGEPNKFGLWVFDTKLLTTESVEFKPLQKTHIFNFTKTEDREKFENVLKDAECDFFITAGHHTDPYMKEVERQLKEKEMGSASFCYRSVWLPEDDSEDANDKNAKQIIDASNDDGFIEIINKSKIIEDDDKKLATDLWRAKNPQSIENLLRMELDN
mgnify:CR=1 FL=1